MVEPKWAFFKVYVHNRIWDTDLANEYGYIRVSGNLIQAANNVIYEKGEGIAITHPKNRIFLNDYLFKGNLVRINPIFSKLAPLCRPDIELHSETKKGLEKLIKDLGLPDNKENVSQE